MSALIRTAQEAGVPIERVPRAEIERRARGVNHQGIIALVASARYRDEDELLQQIGRLPAENPPLLLVLDSLEDPRNFGSILRTAECAGVHGIFVPERRAVGLTGTVAKVSAGALEYIPVSRAGNITRLLEKLKQHGVWTVGTGPAAPVSYTDWDWTLPSAIVLGSEGHGLHRLVREHCDQMVSVPVLGRIESLNVSVAAGVVLYEALRQRRSRFKKHQ